MELEELKNIWKTHDEQLDNHVQVNRELLETVSLDKVKSLLREFTGTRLFEFCFDVMVSLFLINFLVQHFNADWSFIIPAAILLIFSVVDFGLHLSNLKSLYQIHYKDSILETQKGVQQLQLNLRRERQYLYVAIPLFFPLLVLVVAKAWWNLDLYPYLWSIYGITYLLGSLVIAVLVIWLLKKFPDKRMEEAARFLEEIEAFEK